MKIIALMMMMMVLSNKAMASCNDIDNYNYVSFEVYTCIYKRNLPEIPELRKLYLMNVSYKVACEEYERLKDNIAEQSHVGSRAMFKYKHVVDDYIKLYVNPRLKDMEDLKTKFPEIDDEMGMCWAL